MNSARAVAALAVFLCLAASGQNAPELHVSPRFHQFGDISDSHPVAFSISYENRSAQTLFVKKIQTPCTCTVIDWREKGLAPGEKGTTQIVFDPKGRKGFLRWEIGIFTDAAPFVSIVFEANVLQEGVLSESILYFGDFRRSAGTAKKLWISPGQFPDFRILQAYVEIDGKRDAFEVHYFPDRYDSFYPAPRRAYRVEVTPAAGIAFGRHQGKLVVTTDAPGHERLEIPVNARVIGDIGVSRDYVPMGMIASKSEVSRTFTVYNRESKKFRILRVETDLPFLETSVEEVIPEQYYEVKITAKATSQTPAGEFRGEISLVTTSEEQPRVAVLVQGFLRPAEPPRKQGE